MAVSARAPASSEIEEGSPLRRRLAALVMRLRGFLTPPRQIRPTRAGYYFMLLTLAVGFAALNTGNNLLYLILGMMLSLIGVSGVLSELSVQRLRASRRFPHELTVGKDAPVTLTVFNRKRLLPAVGVWLEEGDQDHVEVNPCYYVYVPARGEVSARGTYCFNRRGKQTLARVEISTTYPFGLFRRSYHCQTADEVLVFPRIEAVRPPRGAAQSAEGDVSTSRKGQGEEFYGLRTYHPGDDPRHIHWKTSARRSRLLLREHAAQQRERLVIQLEVTHPLPEIDAYEDGLVKVVSYAAYYLERDYQVGVDVPGGAVPFDGGPHQLRRILRAVALAPLAGEAAEIPPSTVHWPPVGRLRVRVAGAVVSVEEVA